MFILAMMDCRMELRRSAPQPPFWTLTNSSAGNEMEQYEQVTVINARTLAKEPLQNSTAGM
jgi:hypothetical protein